MHPESALYSCPHLGLGHDRRQRYVVPDSGHQCYYRSRPRPVSLQHQAQYCLHPGHYTCPTLAQSRPRPAVLGVPATARVLSVGAASLAALLLVSMVAAFHLGGVDWESAAKGLLSRLNRPLERTVVVLPGGDDVTPVGVHQGTPTTGSESFWELSLPTVDQFDGSWSPSTPVSVAKGEPTRPEPSSRPNFRSAIRLVSLTTPDADQLATQPSNVPGSPGSPDSPRPPAIWTPNADPPPSPTPTPTPDLPAVKTPLGQIVSAIARHQGAEVSLMAKEGGLGDAPKLCPGQNFVEPKGVSNLK